MKRITIRWKTQLIHSIKPSGKLLEIGCGEARLLKELQKNYEVRGIDISLSAIEHASKLLNKKYLRVLNIEKDKIFGRYDIILAFDVLEHLRNPEKSLIKIKKALRKNGVLILTVPNNYGLYGRAMTKYFNFVDKTHVSTYERKKWLSILEQAGFTLDVRDLSIFGIFKSRFAKHFSFNLCVIAKISSV